MTNTFLSSKISLLCHSVPPEGQAISEIKTLLKHYRDTQAELSCLEKTLAAQEPGSPAALLCRRRLLRARLDCLKAQQAIASLPSPRLRLILSLRYLEGLSWREMTDHFSLSESSLYQLHRMALELLEKSYPAPPGRSP